MRYIYFILLLYCLPLQAQQISEKDKTISKYDTIRNTIPREKLYVYFDKNSYTTLDTIWFKGYLVDASLNTPSTISGLIYTEIIDANNEIIQSLALPTIMGLTWGAFALNPEKYKTGNYTFRAYTNWMQNFGKTYFYTKQIKVYSLSDDDVKIAKTQIKTIKSAELSDIKSASNIDLQFLPEGGNLLVGSKQKIAFKALNSTGIGIIVSGEIVDSKQNKIVDFSSNSKGMGIFYLSPIANESYSAKIINFTEKNVALPKAKESSTALQVINNYQQDSLFVTLQSTLVNQPLTIIAQSRGVICYYAKLAPNTNNKSFKIAKGVFPTGICQIIVKDAQQRILNERNFFINHLDDIKINITSNKPSYLHRDSVALHIKAINPNQTASQMSLSVAITDDNQVNKDSLNDANILSYLLLTSDLKGDIENPGSYFKNYNNELHNNLDALMLTQGWVNYDWDLTKKPTYKAEKEFTVSGKVTNATNKPIANAKVTMLGKNKVFTILDTVANKNGEFVFDNLPAMDSASFVIQALNTNDKKGTLGIEVNEFRRPEIEKLKLQIATLESVTDTTPNLLVTTQKDAYNKTLSNGNLLKEVTIMGKRTITGSKNLNGPGEADQIITEEELNKIAKKTLFELISEKIQGFRVGFRKDGSKDFFINFERLKFVIDGIDLDFFYDGIQKNNLNEYYNYVKTYLDYYNAEDIKGVEAMAFFKTSMRYKTKFMDPLDGEHYTFMEITTKSGKGPFLKKSANIYLYKPMNYGNAKVFYAPKYTVDNKNDKTPDFRSTIYWNPNVITNEQGEAVVSFFTADKKGTYTVWVEGSDMQGNFGMKAIKLDIK